MARVPTIHRLAAWRLGVLVPPPAGDGYPLNVAAPVIIGTATEGETLSASAGVWLNDPTSYTYQWRRSGADIAGATASTYLLASADVGTTISVAVTATNANGSATAVSADVGPVAAAAAPEFSFALLDEDGSSAFTSVPNLRVSLDGGTTWLPLGTGAAAGLTLAVDPSDPGALLVSGFTGDQAATALWHYLQEIPGEPASAPTNITDDIPTLYFRRVGGPAPVNASLPGMTVAATALSAPVGVTP